MFGVEGGIFPWKTQNYENEPSYADYGKLKEALPQTPKGYTWVRQADGNWLLEPLPSQTDAPDQGLADAEETEQLQKQEGVELQVKQDFIEHIVLPSDTLIGICLRYKIKKEELRRHNGFVGDNFRLCSTLIIPNKGGIAVKNIQKMTPEIKIQMFQNESKQGLEEAKYYLELASWNVQDALKEWRQDERWETINVPQPLIQKPRGVGTAQCPYKDPQERRRNIDPVDLEIDRSAYKVTQNGEIELSKNQTAPLLG